MNDCGRANPWGIGVTVLLWGTIVAWVTLLYHFLGNTTDVRMFSTSAFRWMLERWNDSTLSAGDYSHGWLIPAVSLYAIWVKRRDIVRASGSVWWPGIWVIVGSVLLHWIGARVQQPRISLLSLVVLTWSIPSFLYGRAVGKLLVFPCAYLVLCIPFNFLDSFTFPLRMMATKVSVVILGGLGIAVQQSGTAVLSIPSGRFALDVADPCSGIRSILAVLALTSAYAYFFQRGWWRRASIFILAVPLAVAGNIARIVVLGIVASVSGQGAALHFYHNYSGFVVFCVVVLLMMLAGEFLQRVGRHDAVSQQGQVRHRTE